MSQQRLPIHFRARWSDEEVPDGEPEWFLHEISHELDAVVREVFIYPNGRITRNSIEIEQRHGDDCPSLIDCGLEDGFAGMENDLIEISAEEFEAYWQLGTDTPFWFTEEFCVQRAKNRRN